MNNAAVQPAATSPGPAETSAPRVLEQLVRQAERAGASDIHLQMRGKTAEVSFRLDGVITPGPELAAEVAERVFGRIKFLARLKTYQESLPQDGRINHADLGAKNDLRVATYPTVTGEKIVLRLFNDTAVKSLRELALGGTAGGALEAFLRHVVPTQDDLIAIDEEAVQAHFEERFAPFVRPAMMGLVLRLVRHFARLIHLFEAAHGQRITDEIFESAQAMEAEEEAEE